VISCFTTFDHQIWVKAFFLAEEWTNIGKEREGNKGKSIPELTHTPCNYAFFTFFYP
jgi:hypothetical protein